VPTDLKCLLALLETIAETARLSRGLRNIRQPHRASVRPLRSLGDRHRGPLLPTGRHRWFCDSGVCWHWGAFRQTLLNPSRMNSPPPGLFAGSNTPALHRAVWVIFVYLYIYMFICLYIYIFIYLYIYIFIYKFMHIYIFIPVEKP